MSGEAQTQEITIESENNCREFPFIDLRKMYGGIVVLLVIFVFGVFASQNMEIPGSVWVSFVPLIGLGFFAFRYARKSAFALRSSHIRTFDGTTIALGGIRSAQIEKRRAVIHYIDASGKESKAVIAFGNVRLDMRDEAKAALDAWLRERGVPVEEK